MNSVLKYKNILITLLRDRSGSHVSGFPTENDFILELSESAFNVLSDQELIDSTEKKLRRAADHVLHSRGIRETCAQTGSFTWDDFVNSVSSEMLGQFGLRKFEKEETVARHVAVAVDRNENLMPDLSDGHVYVFTGRRRRRLAATVSVDLKAGTLTGRFDGPIDPDARYVLAFKDHDELVPLTCVTAENGERRLVIAENGEFASKSEEEE